MKAKEGQEIKESQKSEVKSNSSFTEGQGDAKNKRQKLISVDSLLLI